MGKVPRASRVTTQGLGGVGGRHWFARPAAVGLAGAILFGLGSVPVQASPATEGLPGYGYELVSPASTAGQEVGSAAVSDSGDEVLFTSGGGFADVENLQSLGTTYRGSRTVGGWATHALGGPPASEFPTFTGINVDWTADWWQTDSPLTLWQARPLAASADDLQPVVGLKGGPWHSVASPGDSGVSTWATAADLSGVVQIQRTVRPTLTDGTVDTRNAARFSMVVSARKPDGTLDVRQVAKQAGASLFPTCDISLGGPSGAVTRGAVARDGLSRIVFTTAGTGCTTGTRQRVWVAEPFGANPDAVDASQTRCTLGVACGSAATVRFVGGALDASRLFMTTTQRLLDSDTQAGTDLYEYDFGRPEAERLRLVTPNPTPANVLGVLGVSDDGSHVYFVARGDLGNALHGTAAPVEGAPNLYVRIADPAGGVITRFAGVLDEGDSALWQIPTIAPAVVTPDGRYLAFSSTASLTADKQPGDEHSDVYRFDATTGDLRRAWTDDPDHNGTQRTAGSTIKVMNRTGILANFERARVGLRAVADDGSSINFTTTEPLVATDTNDKDDAFVWTADTGDVAMISDGKDPRGVSAEGMTPDGSTYLFGTVSRLTHEHVATSEGLYAYRRGGGFPAPSAPPGPCSDDGCQPPGVPHPPFGGVGSGVFTGSGNVAPEEAQRPSAAQVRIIGHRATRGTSLRLGVRVTSPGRIRVSGSGLRAVTRRVSKAGTYRVTVRLSPRARRSLERRGLVTVRSRVVLTPTGQRAVSTRPTLRFKQSQKRTSGHNAVLVVDRSKGGH